MSRAIFFLSNPRHVLGNPWEGGGYYVSSSLSSSPALMDTLAAGGRSVFSRSACLASHSRVHAHVTHSSAVWETRLSARRRASASAVVRLELLQRRTQSLMRTCLSTGSRPRPLTLTPPALECGSALSLTLVVRSLSCERRLRKREEAWRRRCRARGVAAEGRDRGVCRVRSLALN